MVVYLCQMAPLSRLPFVYTYKRETNKFISTRDTGRSMAQRYISWSLIGPSMGWINSVGGGDDSSTERPKTKAPVTLRHIGLGRDFFFCSFLVLFPVWS